MQPTDLQNKHVVVIGLGLTGIACVRFLQHHGANVKAMDTRTHLNPDIKVPVCLGRFNSEWLLAADFVVISPGVDPAAEEIQTAFAAGIQIIGDVELFAWFNTCPVIAVTGSNGKSTVTTLVHRNAAMPQA